MTRPSLYVLVTSTVVTLAVALRIADPTPIAHLRNLVFDAYLAAKPRAADPAHPVRIVAIDEASLAKHGQWPWPRTDLALMIERLRDAGAKAIALDLILAEPDRLSPEAIAQAAAKARPELQSLVAPLLSLPGNDSRLADAIKTAPVVLGISGTAAGLTAPAPIARFAAAGDDPKPAVPAYPAAVSSLPSLVAAARGHGTVNWLPDRDQIVRHVPLLMSLGGDLYPSLALETLRVGDGETTALIRSSGASGVAAFGAETGIESIRQGTREFATRPDGQLWLNVSGHDPARYIQAHRVLDGSFAASDVAGRLVLIGATATGLLDLRATPLDAAVPGVEIHAEAIEQMLAGTALWRPSFATGLELSALVGIGLLVAWSIRRLGPLAAAATGFAALGAIAAASWLAFSSGRVLVDPLYPALAVIAVYLAGSLQGYVKTEADRARIRRAFGHYVAAPLVDELAADPAKLKLGGETREVTLLFADVRGFTKLSEGMTAEELIRFVNRLMTPLSEIILDARGTIDKFMGDAVMAFWNAPVSDAQHAANACRAALAMQACTAELNRAAAAEAASRGETPRLVRIGIGLNTGPCCVGNVGSPQRFDYSVLGDAVNVAARLEEATKTFGLPIIAGEVTAARATGFAFLEITSHGNLRGKARSERLFALMGDETLAARPEFAELKARQAAVLTAIEAGPPAGSPLDALERLDWPGLAPLIAYYRSLGSQPGGDVRGSTRRPS